jgi:nucleotide-binding universal stress UspA family protein
MTAPRPTTPRIAVGSDGSARALKWAARQAGLTGASLVPHWRLTGASLEVVTAWELPLSLGRGMPLAIDYDRTLDATTTVNHVVDDMRHAYPDLRIESKVVEGRAAPVLNEASQDADLLVVGSRGHSNVCPTNFARCRHRSKCGALGGIRTPNLLISSSGKALDRG